MKPLAQIRKLGVRDARTACRESGEFGAPDDGWDGWLVNSIGFEATCKLFGLRGSGTKTWSLALSTYDGAARDEAQRLSRQL